MKQSPKPIESPLFTLKQAAEYLDVSVKVIRDLVDRNAFKVVPLAGTIRIRKETLDAWLESQEVYRDDEEAFSGGRWRQGAKDEPGNDAN